MKIRKSHIFTALTLTFSLTSLALLTLSIIGFSGHLPIINKPDEPAAPSTKAESNTAYGIVFITSFGLSAFCAGISGYCASKFRKIEDTERSLPTKAAAASL